MSYGLVLQTAPTTEPLEPADAKKQVEVPESVDAHDALLQSLITAARVYVERYTGRQLITATWDLYLDRFPCGSQPIYVPNSPLIAITSITYTDTAGSSQTWSASDYRVSTSREPGWITPAFGESYPSTRNITDAVRVRYTAGYGAATAVPRPLKQAMLLLISHWFTNREAVLVGSISKDLEFSLTALLESYRVGDEFTCYSPPEVYA